MHIIGQLHESHINDHSLFNFSFFFFLLVTLKPPEVQSFISS